MLVALAAAAAAEIVVIVAVVVVAAVSLSVVLAQWEQIHAERNPWKCLEWEQVPLLQWLRPIPFVSFPRVPSSAEK